MPTTRLTQGACTGTLTCETRHLALITGTRVFRRRRRLSVDVVLFLTGWEAEDAAACAACSGLASANSAMPNTAQATKCKPCSGCSNCTGNTPKSPP